MCCLNFLNKPKIKHIEFLKPTYEKLLIQIEEYFSKEYKGNYKISGNEKYKNKTYFIIQDAMKEPKLELEYVLKQSSFMYEIVIIDINEIYNF